jgi:hypothetical protein
MGWHLSSWFGNNDWIPIEVPKKKKRSLLPLLTVVFLGSYGLMTMLIVEQGHAIQAQHNLIQVLQGDSRELWAMKGKTLTDRASAQNRAEAKTGNPLTRGQITSQTPSTQGQSRQDPSTQAESTQTPSTQAPQRHAQSRPGKGAKPDMQVPPMPASDLSDQRRVLITL